MRRKIKQGYGKETQNVFLPPKKSGGNGSKDDKKAKKEDPYLNRTIQEQSLQAVLQFGVLVKANKGQ